MTQKVVRRLGGRILAGGTVFSLALLTLTAQSWAQWPQWGGKNRDFVSDAKGLASAWPEGGPKKIWSRPLGAGYSSIAFVDDRLYTMYREGDVIGPAGDSNDEIVVALDAQTGKTAWEYKYAAPLPEAMDPQFGKGPNATPLVHDGKVYTFGIGGKLHCIDQKTGKTAWSHDVLAEFGAKTPEFGFSSSPLIYKNSLIVPVGGPGVGVIAFDAASGAVQWKKHDFVNTYSSPIVIRFDGKDEIVLLVGSEVVGMEPATGEMEWRYPFETQYKTNIMTPLWGNDGILFISSAPEVGSRGLKLTRKDGKVIVEEAWTTRKMQIGQANAARVGSHIFACSGEESVFFMTAIEAATGKITWRERGFGKANVVYADGKLIILEEDGSLALATATPEAFQLKSKVPLLKKSSWSTPTLVGQRLFVRDNETIMALDLGNGAGVQQ
jgi:outer membrane protein assembly factor BamB